MRNYIFLLFIVVLGASCVPNKKIVYLQHGDELSNRDKIPRDSILRSHSMEIREYRIQPLDILSINFESLTAEEYDFFSRSSPQTRIAGGGANSAALGGVLVDASGFIEYPVVGKVDVSGLTIFEAQEKLQKIVNLYLKDAVVRIRLLNFRFTILGEVNGGKVINSTNTRITMMEAVGMAGGFSELADRSIVKVIRQKGDISEVFYVNLLEEKYIESPYYYIQQNDIIIVPPLKQRTFRKYFASNLGLAASIVSTVLFIITLAK
ncbi:Polysaccharide export outer membrane protein [Fulvivirga imtechensis AK7]|uniref:Polysaccharide export outer membrane protein n=1 Tax=Fulvivirga imtechensis AK7 TaxID=1237149 RepID=L8JNN6_9BACT|nr:polysaccharide biosynthesis/export family protein [Fulvivirga imtechensis]ELR70581.1 Polysaccharide export outer membrane protein [Fulvivirga imtechensis AK7]